MDSLPFYQLLYFIFIAHYPDQVVRFEHRIVIRRHQRIPVTFDRNDQACLLYTSASIKVGRIHVPQDGVLHFYFCQELIAKRQNIFYRLSKYLFAICIIYRDSHIRLPYIHRIIERGFDFYRTFFPVCRKFRFQANLFKRGFR